MSSVWDDVLQAQISDFPNLFKRGFDFFFARVVQADAKAVEDGFLLVQPRADHEWETEFPLVNRVVLSKQLPLVRCQMVQTRADLLPDGFARERAGQRGASRQIRVHANQRQLFFLAA